MVAEAWASVNPHLVPVSLNKLKRNTGQPERGEAARQAGRQTGRTPNSHLLDSLHLVKKSSQQSKMKVAQSRWARKGPVVRVAGPSMLGGADAQRSVNLVLVERWQGLKKKEYKNTKIPSSRIFCRVSFYCNIGELFCFQGSLLLLLFSFFFSLFLIL